MAHSLDYALLASINYFKGKVGFSSDHMIDTHALAGVCVYACATFLERKLVSQTCVVHF